MKIRFVMKYVGNTEERRQRKRDLKKQVDIVTGKPLSDSQRLRPLSHVRKCLLALYDKTLRGPAPPKRKDHTPHAQIKIDFGE